jgi:thiol-disulfide isomerase/thioredoxin
MSLKKMTQDKLAQFTAENKLSVLLGVSVGLLIALLLIAYPVLAESDASSGEVEPVIYAQAFEIDRYQSDDQITLAEHAGRGVVLNFWASWCHPCREEMPALEAAWKKYENQGISFIGINSSDNKEQGQAFLEEYGVTYPNGVDAKSKVSELYQVIGLPSTWFIAPDGSVEKIVYGPLDMDALDAAISLILPGVNN